MQSIKETLETQGYAVVENVVGSDLTDRLIADYSALTERLANDFVARGIIPDAFSTLPLAQRIGAILSSSRINVFKYFDIAYPNEPITAESPIHLSPAVFALITHPPLLDIIESIIGSELLANPIQHVRIKPPQATIETKPARSSLIGSTGWHQDQGVSRPEADATEMVTVWVAITDATIENGCLQVVPYSHLEGIVTHCPTDQMTIPTALLGGEPLPVPIKAGDALLLHRLTKHASLPNRSGSIRWSFDLRYQPIGQPTGRNELPATIVRSRQHPEREVRDFAIWQAAWLNIRPPAEVVLERAKTHRWDGDAPACA